MALPNLNLNGHEVPVQTQLEGGMYFTPDAAKSKYILVTCRESLQSGQEQDLQAEGARILTFEPPAAYICRYEDHELGPIRGLSFVVAATVYNQDLVVHPELIAQNGGDKTADSRQMAHITLHPQGDRNVEQVREELAKMLGISKEQVVQDGSRFLRANIRLQDLSKLAAHDDVQCVAPVGRDKFLNHVARSDLKVNEADWVTQRLLPAGHRPAEGEIIAITDSGIDLGRLDDMHPAFPLGSIRAIRRLGDVEDGGDDLGHGTHCAASIVGSARSPLGNGLIEGTAASLIVQSASRNLDAVVNSEQVRFSEIFLGPLRNGNACIHSISWNDAFDGGKAQGYSTKAHIVDEVVYNTKELLIVQGAGNEGVRNKDLAAVVAKRGERPRPSDAPAIDGKATAKNILTVGACESTRPMRKFYSPYLDAGVLTPAQSDMTQQRDPYTYVPSDAQQIMLGEEKFDGDTGQIAWFSSCGPTVPPAGSNKRRIKPDLVAPGVSICSAMSRHPKLNILKKYERTPQYNWFGEAPNGPWFFLSGTSHSAPLAAGCAAIIRKALREKYGGPVLASAIKAVLINNAEDLSFRNTNVRGPPIKQAPDGAQGYGLLDTTSALLNVRDANLNGDAGVSSFIDPHGGPLTPPGGKEPFREYIFIIPGRATFRPINLMVTLAWTDFPGVLLVNELSLKVQHANGSYMWGNDNTVYPDKMVLKGSRDNSNNVQKVVWQNIPPGGVTVRVECHAIPRLEGNATTQNYSLAYQVKYGT